MAKIKKLSLLFILVIAICFITNIYKNNENKNYKNENELSKKTSTNNSSSNSDKEAIKVNELIFTSSPIPEDIKNKMLGKSMPTNIPISFDSLAYLKVTYYGFDNTTHVGELIVDKSLSEDLIEIFKELYENKYPIEKIKLIDEYDASDEASMTDNNSSAFCYRTIAGTNKISNHGKGRAIDINPLQNPHVVGNIINPIDGSSYADRTTLKNGMIVEGDICYNAFVKRGWSWGGHWKNPDYQHFEKK